MVTTNTTAYAEVIHALEAAPSFHLLPLFVCWNVKDLGHRQGTENPTRRCTTDEWPNNEDNTCAASNLLPSKLWQCHMVGGDQGRLSRVRGAPRYTSLDEAHDRYVGAVPFCFWSCEAGPVFSGLRVASQRYRSCEERAGRRSHWRKEERGWNGLLCMHKYCLQHGPLTLHSPSPRPRP
jgi:hypothetical protein